MVASDIGIDLGTANVLVYIKGKGVVLREPSVVAFDRDTNKIKAIGEDARLMLGRTPGNIVAVRPLVRTDGLVLFQVLDNLLSNAVKYTPPGGRIRISVHGGEAAWEVRLENYGITIPEALLPHIYEPFVSGSHGTDAAGAKSHGLGLYIASYYARKLGIGISVCNGEGGDHVAVSLVYGKG